MNNKHRGTLSTDYRGYGGSEREEGGLHFSIVGYRRNRKPLAEQQTQEKHTRETQDLSRKILKNLKQKNRR